MTALVVALLAASAVLAIYAGLVSLLTSPRVAALNSGVGGRTLYDQTCLNLGLDPLADHDIEGTP